MRTNVTGFLLEGVHEVKSFASDGPYLFMFSVKKEVMFSLIIQENDVLRVKPGGGEMWA